MAAAEQHTNTEFELRGFNHLALVCRDMAETVEWYEDKLGMKLVKTLELPGGHGQHFFLDMGNGRDGVAFFWFPNAPEGERVISNVVMMGMGEPLQNYSALVPALRVMLDDHAYGLSRRRVTVSTSGVVPMIDRLGEDCPVALAVSLHAPNDELRDKLVPLNRKYPIADLLDACKRYLVHAPRDFITFEYCMLDGVNDQPEHARELVELVRHHGGHGIACKLNLIPFNPFPASGLVRSPQQRVQAFAKILSDAGIVTTVRKTRGDDIDAACGQLAGDVKDRTRAAQRMAQQRTIMLKPVAAQAHDKEARGK